MRSENREGCKVIYFEGNIDLYIVDGLRDQIVELLAEEPSGKVILHCGGVNRMDSSGVGLFIFLRSRYRDKVAFRICELPERILELFRMTQLETFFDMDAREADSLKAFQV